MQLARRLIELLLQNRERCDEFVHLGLKLHFEQSDAPVAVCIENEVREVAHALERCPEVSEIAGIEARGWIVALEPFHQVGIEK
jgi:hypothetical protein